MNSKFTGCFIAGNYTSVAVVVETLEFLELVEAIGEKSLEFLKNFHFL